MVETSLLAGRKVLLVEDEYLLALDLQLELERSGATVIGPVGRVSEALALLDGDPPSVAVLDINLHGEAVFPVADRLTELRIPFLFATGQEPSAIPEHHRGAVRLSKPVPLESLIAHLAQLTGSGG